MQERLGEFQIKKKLGEGGMGAVYLAYQESLDRDVALKVLTERLCQNEKFIARFKREARSAASIVHPNVIQIYSIGETDRVHFFAMEYVRGKDVAVMLGDGRQLEIDLALDIVQQVAEACACAHEAGIIHRDIKPANIMMTDRGHVKVTDFGLAKPIQSELNVTDEGMIVGTANYMSPEQGQGRALDARSDIYSLGVVLYEILAGRLPFVADQPAAVLYMHIYETPSPPSKFNPAIPPALDRMVERMMAKSPNDRPKNAEILLQELRGLRQSLGGGPKAASVVGPAAAAKGPTPAVQAAPAAAPAAPGATARKVLVVDDDAGVRRLYETVLAPMGLRILMAEDGEKALDLWRRESPALVILDLVLPKKDGFAVLAERASLPPAEVIVISAHKERDRVARAAACGVQCYMMKPVNNHELRARVERMLSASPAAVPAKPAAAGPESEESGPGTGKAVLIYDRTPYARTLCHGVLEGLGCQIAPAETPEEALAVVDAGPIDLAVLVCPRDDRAARTLFETLRQRAGQLPVLGIVDEGDEDRAVQLKAKGAGRVLMRPLRIGELRNGLEALLVAAPPRPAQTELSCEFRKLADRRTQREQNYTLFDLARELAQTLPAGQRASFETRLQEGSLREVHAASANLLRRLKTDGRVELAMRYVRHAYSGGNLEVRNFCLALLPELVGRKEEVEILGKVIGDEDFRIRIQILDRLGELQAAECVDLIIRFLNDDVWKVRKAAATCLEKFDLDQVLQPLLLFYARSGEPIPERIRARLVGEISGRDLGHFEALARSPSPTVRAYVAAFLGELKTKLAIEVILKMFADAAPQVRAAAVRSAGRFQNAHVREALTPMLTDANSEVQAAAIESLRPGATPDALVFLDALAARGKRIAPEALPLLATLGERPGMLCYLLERLAQQGEAQRRYLSLLLAHLLPQPGVVEETARQLAGDAASQKAARDRVESAMRKKAP